jgi:uncharacterized protein YkwD
MLVLLLLVLMGQADFVGMNNSMVLRCNAIRQRHRLGAMTEDQRLTNAAQDHANFMARYRLVMVAGPNGIPTYHNPMFRHDTNGGDERRRQKYGWMTGGQEIIAMQPKGWRVDCWDSWTFSALHYSAILSNHSRCGFASAVGPDGCVYSVGIFGSE